jgi:large subunit ribosomal protein L45
MRQADTHRQLWQHVASVERPRVVHARVVPLQDKKTEFAQVTVRVHSRQTLVTPGSVGSGSGAPRTREVVDYIVVESTITSKTPWRICGRLHPKWAS